MHEVFLSAEPCLEVVDHKLNTERNGVCRFCWWCACTCMAVPLFASGLHLSPLPPTSDVSERSVMSYIFSSFLLSCAPSSPSVVLLPMMLLRNYRRGWGGREIVLLASVLHLLNYPSTVLFSLIHSLLLLLLLHPHLPLDPGVW